MAKAVENRADRLWRHQPMLFRYLPHKKPAIDIGRRPRRRRSAAGRVVESLKALLKLKPDAVVEAAAAGGARLGRTI